MTSRSNLATDCQEMVFVVESDYDIEIRGLHATDEAAAEAARFVVGVVRHRKNLHWQPVTDALGRHFQLRVVGHPPAQVHHGATHSQRVGVVQASGEETAGSADLGRPACSYGDLTVIPSAKEAIVAC